jgi:NAD(P)H-hydrate repair Nnr-like enzyme with NAD(P)H-hydrate dehydratase domain
VVGGRRAATRFGSIVLLKGGDTLVAAPRGGVLVSLYGEPSLAAAGTGDVLTGVVAAFLAKGLDAQLAAALAAVAHGVASKIAPHQAGLIASDLLPGIQRAIGGDGWQFPEI